MARQQIFQPLVLATVLATGFMAVCFAADSWILSDYREEALGAGEELCLLPDGTLLVASHPDGVRWSTRYHDLQGNPTTPAEDEIAAQLRGAFLPASPPHATDELDWSARARALPDGRWPATYWYFLSDGRPQGNGYFVGYDSKSKVCIGYLGTSGFRKEPLPAEELFPFDGPTWAENSRLLAGAGSLRNPTTYPVRESGGRAPQGFLSEWDAHIFGRDGKLYHADLHERTVQVILADSPLCSIAASAHAKLAVRGTLFRLAARTDDAILILDTEGRQLARYPIPETLHHQDLTFAESNVGEAVLYESSPDDSLGTTKDYRIFWVKADGLFREAAVTLAHYGDLRSMRVYGGVAMPSPLGLASSTVRTRYKELLNKGLSAAPAEALVRALTEFWPALALAQTIALICTVLCYRRQVRYGVSRTERIVWPLFVLLLGLPGWIGYRFGRSWPVLEACPECGAAVPCDRESCVRCANDFPRPVLKGTEVFA
ncbi:MAG TPA: hypothetical protein VMG10_14105 [Gemmataceae bacterium]|nr:hypothetical protein [Gemmataceae bacterium]